MQSIIVEKPYKFTPPVQGTFWSSFFRRVGLHRYLLRKTDGVVDHEVRELEHLQQSLAAGHSILITPNHPRTSDPLAMGFLSEKLRCHVYAMASWHLFNQRWLDRWVMQNMGAFSVNREGVDRQSISTAIDLLAEGKRPLIIFPEGATGRTNDRLQALLDGVAFIARSAAKKRLKQDPNKRVVIHPIAIKYRFQGDIKQAASDVLGDIEKRLTWHSQAHLPLLERIGKVGSALLSLKEMEHLGATRPGTLAERLQGMIDHLLHPAEKEWLAGPQGGPVVPRVRNLRVKIIPEMLAGSLEQPEKDRRWKQLADLYLAQQLSCYPPDYLASRASVDRILETIERFEEDMYDKCRLHGHLKVILQVAPAIEVPPDRDRGAPVDPLMVKIQQSLEERLQKLALESPEVK